MTKRARTEKSKYKHTTTGDYCTCAAYIAELMCIRKSEYENRGSLRFKFWNYNPWKWTFTKQLYKANSLIKKYGEASVVRAVNSSRLKKVFSLNHKWVLPEIKNQKAILDAVSEKVQELDVKENVVQRKKSYGKSKLNKLRDIDGKKENQD